MDGELEMYNDDDKDIKNDKDIDSAADVIDDCDSLTMMTTTTMTMMVAMMMMTMTTMMMMGGYSRRASTERLVTGRERLPPQSDFPISSAISSGKHS